MSDETTVRTIADAEVEAYATEHSTAHSPRLAAVHVSTQAFSSMPGMMVGPLEGGLLGLLVSITGARRILEVGTFTGYSAITMAEAMPADGRITTLELSAEHAARARENISEAGFTDVVEVVEGPAAVSMAALDGPFDLVFIDADKGGYPTYYDLVVPLLRPGGLLVGDNVLWSGRVLDVKSIDPDTVAMRRFNAKVATDPRVECVMLTVRDGVSLIRRRD
jgi:caffeoyl-CoA O-methyltransferase